MKFVAAASGRLHECVAAPSGPRVWQLMKHLPRAIAFALALCLALPRAAQAHDDTALVLFDVFLNLLAIGVQAAALEEQHARPPSQPPEDSFLQQRYPDDEWPPPRWSSRPTRPRHDARQGLLMSFGIGGGSLFLSQSDGGRTGAFDLDFRLGYGFSDRFQLFGDVSVDAATYPSGADIASWTATMRGQTVLIGDRQGNGLNLNAGVGLGGISKSYNRCCQSSSPTGLALVGGVSYDARLSPLFSLSPEFFVTWHAVPNPAPFPQDIATSYGLRLNFLWYIY